MISRFRRRALSPPPSANPSPSRLGARRVTFLKRLGLLPPLVAMLATTIQAPVPAVAADVPHMVTVRLVITHVLGLDCTDEDEVLGGCGSDPDFYARVHLDDQTADTEESVADDTNELRPDWTFEKRVDLARGKVPLVIRLRDQDGGFRGPSDPVDIDPGAGRDLELSVNLAPCGLRGDITAECVDKLVSTGTITSDGSENDRARIEFRVEVTDGDGDGDALLDGWETRGLDTDGDGSVDVDLPALGADPRRHDLFVEIDCLRSDGNGNGTFGDPEDHSHCPERDELADVVRSFANASPGPGTTNPDGTTGVQLHLDTGPLFGAGGVTEIAGGVSGAVIGSYGDLGRITSPLRGGNQIAETAANQIVDWDGATGSPATSFFDLKNANFDAKRRYAFRYALFLHQTNFRSATNDCTSGWAESTVANDFFVSLGGRRDLDGNGTGDVPCWTSTATNNLDDDGDGRIDEDQVDGTDNDGDCSADTNGDTVVCGGGDVGVDEDGGFSLGSRAERAGTFMHEFGHALGLDHGGGDVVNDKPNYFSVMQYSMQQCSVPNSRAFPARLPGGCDYSRDRLGALEERLGGGFQGLDECHGPDLGYYGFAPSNWDGDALVEGVTNCRPPSNANVSFDVNGDSQLTRLDAFDDWDSLKYPFQVHASFANGVVDPVRDEADPATIERARKRFAERQGPDLAVDKRGPALAAPGDTVTYTIEVTNNGRGPAVDTVLRDTLPDGSTMTFDLGYLPVGKVERRTVSYTVPCDAADGSVLVDTAAVSGKDLLGGPEATPANNTDSVSTTVNAPVITLSKAASPAVNAGEAITSTITYRNAGTAGASGVTITDTLPAGVYYSAPLDTGAGPRPAAVTRNANGTTTLTWDIGSVPAASGERTIQYTARPSLLARTGTSLRNDAVATFTNANGCVYQPVLASAATVVTEVAPTRTPRGLAFWLRHPDGWTAEVRARVQATDQRFDGADGTVPDGLLTAAEVATALRPKASGQKPLAEQSLATYLNLATRRINAGTAIRSSTATTLGMNLPDVRAAVEFARATLGLPVNSTTMRRYSAATAILDEINNNLSERY